jgi:hypothetical protein
MFLCSWSNGLARSGHDLSWTWRSLESGSFEQQPNRPGWFDEDQVSVSLGGTASRVATASKMLMMFVSA